LVTDVQHVHQAPPRPPRTLTTAGCEVSLRRHRSSVNVHECHPARSPATNRTLAIAGGGRQLASPRAHCRKGARLLADQEPPERCRSRSSQRDGRFRPISIDLGRQERSVRRAREWGPHEGSARSQPQGCQRSRAWPSRAVSGIASHSSVCSIFGGVHSTVPLTLRRSSGISTPDGET
jgi:hypothetical protein